MFTDALRVLSICVVSPVLTTHSPLTFFFLMIRPPPRPPLFPSTTLSRSPPHLSPDVPWPNSAPDRRTTLINPATEEPFGEVAAADVADVNAAVESAQRVWESGWRDVAP